MRGIIIKLICFSFIYLPHAFSNPAFVKRHDVQSFINDMVKTQGFNRQYLTHLMDQVALQPSIIESMEKPYEKKTWDVYKALFLTPERMNEGLRYWSNNEALLKKAEKQYGVPANIIVAILGVETLYGKHQGKYRVLDALSTLAFNYPKRGAFFTKELKEYLLLCKENGISPTEYLGSYAGAMGKPQFIPSSYRYYAANFSGKPKKDLMNDDEAVIASVANYFHSHGWQLNEAVTQPAYIINDHYKQINTDNKIASYTPSQLAKAGVRVARHNFSHIPSKAGLIELKTQAGSEFWMTYPNFYVITRYNTSPQYALAVYLLAQKLQENYRPKHLIT